MNHHPLAKAQAHPAALPSPRTLASAVIALLAFWIIAALLGLLLAVSGCRKDDSRSFAEQTKDATNTAVEKTKAVALDVKSTLSAKLVDWHLTPAEIRADLEKGGRIARKKTAVAGERLGSSVDNARIVTVINAKLIGDDDLSALKINVDADAGIVTLKGTVSSAELIGKAMVLALDTEGVKEVISQLTIDPSAAPTAN